MSTIQSEIEQIKDFDDIKVKIIKNIGEFSHVMNITYLTFDVTITLQITGKYPDEPPLIILKCMKNTEQHEDILLHLNSFLLSSESNIVVRLVHAGHEWLKGNYQELCAPAEIESEISKKKKQKHRVQNKDESGKDSKKPMKTATDVINRILWDDLPTSDFLVGYLDRFVGIVERKFKDFSWEDIASVDYDTLAIPKHRIQYFKYKNAIIWDKRDRTDLVFGSTDSDSNIYDVIANYQEAELSNESEIRHGGDSDDEVSVEMGINNAVSKPYNSAKESYWGPKNRPTHFLAVRVTDPEIVESVKLIQDDILHIEPSYESILMPPERLHMTLACVGLDTYSNIQSFVELLESIKDDLILKAQNISIKFKSTDNFFDRVLYAAVEVNQELNDFVEYVQLNIRSHGFEVRDIFDFHPHMTLLKLSNSKSRDLKCPYLDGRLYNAFIDREFGEQKIDNIYLCEMSEVRDFNDFYITPFKVIF